MMMQQSPSMDLKKEHREEKRMKTSELFDGRLEIIIDHNDEAYRLRITSKGKLILTK